MPETPEQYTDRVLAYVLKATREVDINDPALNKAEPEKKPEPINPFDAAIKAFETDKAEEDNSQLLKDYQKSVLKDLKNP